MKPDLKRLARAGIGYTERFSTTAARASSSRARTVRTVAAIVLCTGALGGCHSPASLRSPAAAVPVSITTGLHLGPGFPDASSFYPPDARRALQEGAVVVAVCVDAQGKLSGVPSVAISSGWPTLDAAALDLARAGDGLYLSPRRNGKPLAGCDRFKVSFVLNTPTDPRWPTLSRRIWAIGQALEPRAKDLRSGVVRAPDRTTFVPGDIEQLRQVREAARSGDELLEGVDKLLSDYVGSIDQLETDSSIPEAERTAFYGVWPARRQVLQARSSEMLEAGHDMVHLLEELADYIESSRPPLVGPSGPAKPTASQQQHLEAIFDRGANGMSRLKAAMEAWAKAFADSVLVGSAQ
jgi:TonB family protein